MPYTLTEPDLDAITRRIVLHLQPERVVLFGSRARGDGDTESDVDLCVVLPQVTSRREREVQVGALFPERTWALDVTVVSSEEWKSGQRNEGSVVWTISREGKVLYERR